MYFFSQIMHKMVREIISGLIKMELFNAWCAILSYEIMRTRLNRLVNKEATLS